jgi:hypothetical protein
MQARGEIQSLDASDPLPQPVLDSDDDTSS